MKHRKILSAVLSAAMLLGCTALLAAAPADKSSVRLGDADLDGDITLRDAILLARTNADLVWLSGNARIAADIDGNGTLDSNDLILMLRHLCGKDTVLGEKENTVMLNKSKNLMENIRKDESIAAYEAENYRAGQMAFIAEMFKRVSAENTKQENLMISPLSMELALSMTANGAKGVTQEEMLKVLGGSLTMEEMNASHLWLMQQLGIGEKSCPLTVANAIWIKDSAAEIRVPEPFLQTNADYYQAGAYLAPFNEDTVAEINNWVKAKTDDMIPHLLDSFDPDEVMALINTICFDADWVTPIEDACVHDGIFTAADGTEQTVRMMTDSSGTLPYLETENATGFVKYYRNGYSFAAILPKEGMSTADYIASLDADAIEALLKSRTSEYDVTAYLPEFKFDFDCSLREILTAMGMPTAFGANSAQPADFTGLNEVPDTGTRIGRVLHKTHIELNQSGTRAAAVTAVLMNCESVRPEPLTICLDRPFVFMILNEKTQMPIFIGAVNSIE